MLDVDDRRNVKGAETVDHDDLALAGQLVDQLLAIPRGPDPRSHCHQKPNQGLASLAVEDRQKRRLWFSKPRLSARGGRGGCFSICCHGGHFRGGWLFGGMALLLGWADWRSSGAASPERNCFRCRAITSSASAERFSALADFSSALVYLR